MSMIYDNWERLVAAVLKREEIWQLCHQPSRTPSISSESSSDLSSSFRSSSDVKPPKKDESVQKPPPELTFLGGPTCRIPLQGAFTSTLELGRGRFGTSILARLNLDVKVSDQEFLAEGTELVTKLLNEVKVTEEEFKLRMMVFRNCGHENVAAPRAYYFSDKANGKLIVYDYHRQRSVAYMLHVKGALIFSPDWKSRLKIAIGAARGIAHIHTQSGGKLAHGNVKSSNVFLNSEQYGCVCGLSLAGVVGEKPPVRRGLRYDAAAYHRSVSQEADVYNFGNVLLELVTGKSPLEPHGFEKDMELVTWVSSVKSQEWTCRLFDQRLRRPLVDENDLIEMAKTEIPGFDAVARGSGVNAGALRALLGSHFHSMARVPAGYFRAQDLKEMEEMLRVATRCLAVFPEDRPKMSDVVLMLENIASLSDGKPQQAQNYGHSDEKGGVWNRFFRLGRSYVGAVFVHHPDS